MDLPNRWVAGTLLGAESGVIGTRAGEIIIRPASVPRMIAERQISGLEGSVFSGAGFLSEAAHHRERRAPVDGPFDGPHDVEMRVQTPG